MKQSNKLSRDEMKKILGGTGQNYVWSCNDYAGGPFISTACAPGNPITLYGSRCPEYSCHNTGVTCGTATGACS